MAVFTPSSQPVNVGVAGTVVEVEIPSDFRAYRIDKIQVSQEAGAGAATTVDVGTTNPPTDASRIAKFTGLAAGNPVNHDNGGRGYIWDAQESTGKVYVKLTPDAGSNNNYTVKLHVTKVD